MPGFTGAGPHNFLPAVQNKPMMKKMLPFAAAEYAVIALYQSFSSLYFAGKGLETASLAWVQLAVPLASLLGQPLWGALADKTSRPWVLRAVILAAALAVCLLPLGQSLLALAALAGLFAFFQTSIQPLGDALMLPELNRAGEKLGPLRVTAPLVAMVTALAAGYGFSSRGEWLPWAVAAFLLLALGFSFLLPGDAAAAAKKGSLRELFTNRRFMVLLAFSLPLQCSLGLFFCYFPVYFTDTLGGSAPLLGWAYALGAACEIPFLLLADRLFARLGPGKMLLGTGLCLFLRYGLLALCVRPVPALLTQVLAFGGFASLSFAMAKAAAALVPPSLAARAQTLVALAGFSLARGIALAAGGFLTRIFSLNLCFLFAAGLCGGALLILGKKLWQTDFS